MNTTTGHGTLIYTAKNLDDGQLLTIEGKLSHHFCSVDNRYVYQVTFDNGSYWAEDSDSLSFALQSGAFVAHDRAKKHFGTHNIALVSYPH